MIIKVFPEDLVKLGIWDTYTYYIVGNEKEAEKILLNNIEFEINESDSLVIGLLKVVQTPNIIHRFNSYMIDFLTSKTIYNNGVLLIRKKGVITTTEKFFAKYPDYWDIPMEYKRGIEEARVYVDDFLVSVETLPIIEVTNKFGTFEYVQTNLVRKILKFNYY